MKNAGLCLALAAALMGCGGRQGNVPESAAAVSQDTAEAVLAEEEPEDEETETEVDEYGLPVTYDTVRVGRETLVLKNVENEGSGMIPTTMYRHTGDEVTEMRLEYVVKYERGNGFFLLLDDFNAMYEPGDGSDDDGIFIGHCYYAYPCRYENGRFREYRTTEVPVASFLKRRGAREYVDGLASEGWNVTEVLDREDGHTFLNLRRNVDGGGYEQAYADFGHDFMESGVYRRRILNDDGLTLYED